MDTVAVFAGALIVVESPHVVVVWAIDDVKLPNTLVCRLDC